MNWPAQGVAELPPGAPEPPGRRHRRLRPLHLLLIGLVVVVTVAVVVVVTRSIPSSPAAQARPAAPSAGAAPAADGYAVRCLAVGAAVPPGTPGGAGQGAFRRQAESLGPLTIRRSFDSSLPASFEQSAAAGDAASGLHTFVSWKPPGGDIQGTTAGRYDEQITAWAKSVPRTGVYATAFHEPENDMTAAQFVAFERHVYRVVKAANPTIHWGPVYMAYWWDPGELQHYVGDPAAWWPGNDYADFAALDWYAATPRPMTTSPSFLNWYRTMQPHGVPLYITEYGQYVLTPGQTPDPALEQARARAITQDAAWIAAHPAMRMWVYWQGFGPRGDWRMLDSASQQAWQRVADSGCRR